MTVLSIHEERAGTVGREYWLRAIPGQVGDPYLLRAIERHGINFIMPVPRGRELNELVTAARRGGRLDRRRSLGGRNDDDHRRLGRRDGCGSRRGGRSGRLGRRRRGG